MSGKRTTPPGPAVSDLDTIQAALNGLRPYGEGLDALARLRARLEQYEEPGWINPVQKVLELQGQAERLREALMTIEGIRPDEWYGGQGWECVSFIQDIARAALSEANP